MRKQIIRNLSKDDEFTVEEIIGKRRRGNRVEYLVKWQDFPEEESTWEPIENLINVWELIEDYEKNLLDEERGKKKFRIKPDSAFSGNTKRKPFARRQDNSEFEYEEDLMEEEDEFGMLRDSRNNANYKNLSLGNPKEPRNEGRPPWLQKDNLSRTMGKQFKVKPQTKLFRGGNEVNLEAELKISSEEEDQTLPELGDFRFGDHARQILKCKPKGGEIIVTVEWHPRPNKTVPKNTTMPTSIVKKFDPELLIDFYETKLRFVPRQEEGGADPKQESTDAGQQSADKPQEQTNEQKETQRTDEKVTKKPRTKPWTSSKEIEAN